jgi:N-sulfoglucosamine sulfohydrolase
VDREYFVSGLDVYPTICKAIGALPDDDADGHDLSGPWEEGRADADRSKVFSVYHENAIGQRFEMRCRQDERWGYIRNAWSDGVTSYWAENMTGGSWSAMQDVAGTDVSMAARTRFYLQRAPEELYDLEVDPGSLTNLAFSHAHQGVLNNCRTDLRDWMHSTRDPLRTRYGDEIS